MRGFRRFPDVGPFYRTESRETKAFAGSPGNTLDVRCYVGPLYDAGGDGWVESSYTWPG
jgi:hypothetical protein